MKNTSLTPESDIELWTKQFFSILEPREDFKELLSKMIDIMNSFLEGKTFPQEFHDYFFRETLPGAIKKIIHFQSISFSASKEKVVKFLREAAKFVNYSLQNNLENLYSPLISMLNPESIVYQKNNNYGEPFYTFVYRDYFTSEDSKKTSFFFIDNNDVKITHYNFIFKIYSNNLKGKTKKPVLNLSSTIMTPYVEYINSIENLHDVNTRALQDSLISFIDLTVDKLDYKLYIQLFNFLKKCLKSDMIEKQLIAAKTISNFCHTRNDILNFLQNSQIKETIENFLDEATNPELNIAVVNSFIQFFETLCNPKVSLIHFDHICKLYDIASSSSDSEQQSPLFTFIANSIDGFEEEIQLNICDYITRPPTTTSTFKFLTKLTKTFWKSHQDKALGYVSLVLYETERDQSAREAIISIYKQNIIPVEARILLVKEILKKISYNEESAEFAQIVLCSMIDSSNSLREIFTKEIDDEIIQQMTNDNKKHIFKILTKLFSKSSIRLTKENFNFFSSFGKDDELWSFYKDLFDTNKLFRSDDFFDLIVEQAQDQALSDEITKVYVQFLISLIGFENKMLFNSWKRKNSSIDGTPKYIDILFQAFASSNDEEATKICEDYLLQIFTTMKPIRDILFSFIESQLEDEKFISNYNVLNIILNFIETSEDDVDPEDFNYERHKYQSDLFILKCTRNDDFQFKIHINPESSLSVLLHRIAIRTKNTKATSTNFMKLSDKKTLNEIGIKNNDNFSFSINYESTEYEMPFSLHLMKSGFVRKLLSISSDDMDEKFLTLIQKLLDILPTDEQVYKTDCTKMDEFVDRLRNDSSSAIEKKYYLQSLLTLIRKEKEEEENESDDHASLFVDNNGIEIVIINLLMRFNDPFYFEFLLEFIKKFTDSFSTSLEIIITRFFDSVIENWANHYSFLILRNSFRLFNKETVELVNTHQDKLYESFEKVARRSWNNYTVTLELEPTVLFQIAMDHIHQDQVNLPFFVKILSNAIKKIIKEYKEDENNDTATVIYSSDFLKNICSMLEWKEVKPSIEDLVEIIFSITNKFASKNKELKEITKEHEEMLTSIVFDTSDPNTQQKLIDIIKLSYSEKTEQYLEKLFNNNKDIEDHWNYSPDLFKRESPYIGLRNLGATCFFNSIIQQLYHLFPVQYIMATHEFEKDSELILLQSLFLQMHYSERKFCDTEPFIKQWHGWLNELINPREQHDAVEFFTFLIDALPDSIKKLFTGKQINIITRKNGDLFHSDSVPFINLSVSIKGINNLDDSLQNLIATEELQKQDDLTNKKITVLKTARIEEAPPILVISLERFEYLMKTYERKKLNDRFTFPDNLNIDSISQKLTNTNYKLVGVVVHSGTAIGGHYISFVKKNANKTDNQWWKFNDIEVSQVSKEDVESSAFGSATQQSSAYVLFYIKEDFVLNVNESTDETVSFFKELDYTDKVDIDYILNDNLAFKHTQSIFSEPIINFVLCIKKNLILQLNFFIKVLCHSQFEKKSLEFADKLVKRINKYQKNKECLLYLYNIVHKVYENFLNVAFDDIIKGLSNIIICCSKEDISICIPILDLLKQNVYSFRQTPSVYEMIYKIIKNIIDAYINDKQLNIVKIYQDFNDDKIDDPLSIISRKIIEIITFAYTESRPQLFASLNFTFLFNTIQELITKIGVDKIDLSTFDDFRSMIIKSNLHITSYNKMMSTYNDSRKKKKSNSYFDTKSLTKPSYLPQTTRPTISSFTTTSITSSTKAPTYASPNRNTLNKPKQASLVLREETTTNQPRQVSDQSSNIKEIRSILGNLTNNANFSDSLKKFVNEKPQSALVELYDVLYVDMKIHYKLKLNFIEHSPKYFIELFVKKDIEYREATLKLYKKFFNESDRSIKRDLVSNFNHYFEHSFQENINFAYNKISNQTKENSYLFQFLEFYKYMVTISQECFKESNAKMIFDTIRFIHKKDINNDINMKILLEILGNFDSQYTNNYFDPICDIILNSKSTIYMEALPLFFTKSREKRSLDVMKTDDFSSFIKLCWEKEKRVDNIEWQKTIKTNIPKSSEIFDRIYGEFNSAQRSKSELQLKDLVKKDINIKNKSPNEIGSYITCFFDTVQKPNPSNTDTSQFVKNFIYPYQNEIGKCNFNPERVEELLKRSSFPPRIQILDVLKHLFKYSTIENDQLLFKLIDYQIADKFSGITPAYFQELIPFLLKRNGEVRIKKIIDSLHSQASNLTKVYEIIKGTIMEHNPNFDHKWIEKEISKVDILTLRRSVNFFVDILSLLDEQQIVSLFEQLQKDKNYTSISCLVQSLSENRKTPIIEKLKSISKFNSLPPEKKWKPNDSEKKYFKMIIKEIGVDEDYDDDNDSVSVICQKRK